MLWLCGVPLVVQWWCIVLNTTDKEVCVVSVECCSCDPGHQSTVTLVKNYDLKLEAKGGFRVLHI